MIFPWQLTEWNQLWDAKKKLRLPHAILLSGMKGLGKMQFARSFIHSLLCARSSKEAPYYCGDCHDCRLIAGNVHPNVRLINPEKSQEKSGQSIKVDQIRDVNEFVQTTSLQGEYRIVLIHPADQMNLNAANALLKTLEEPAPFAILILVCEQASSLPATILSRCQKIHFMRPDKASSIAWLSKQLPNSTLDLTLLLNLANGAPLSALQLHDNNELKQRQIVFQLFCLLKQHKTDPLQSANDSQEIEVLRLLDYLLSWMIDLLHLQLGCDPKQITNRDFLLSLTELQQSTHVEHNMRFLSFLKNLRMHIVKGINLNKQLMIENIWIKWWETTSCS